MRIEDLARRAEEACLNGWPALSCVLLDGWLLRFADGHTKRSNAITPIAPAAPDERGRLVGKIRACEALYTARDLPTIFRLSSTVAHRDLSAALDVAGYDPPHDETRVLVAETSGSAPAPGAPVHLTEGAPGPAWLEAFARITDLDGSAAVLHGRILGVLAVPAAFAAVEAPDGTTGAVAFGAVHDGLVCLNSVATAPEHRGRGLAGRAVGTVMAWAKARAGADAACLPVGAGNAPALALYRRLGFTTEVSRYHYRVSPKGRG